MRVDIPDEVVESLAPEQLPGWDSRESPEARAFGHPWLHEERSAVLAVPSLPARPIGRTLLINPRDPDAAHIRPSQPFIVPWDERLF